MEIGIMMAGIGIFFAGLGILFWGLQYSRRQWSKKMEEK